MISTESLAGASDSVHQEKFNGSSFEISLNHTLGYVGVCRKEHESSFTSVFFIQGDEAGFYMDLFRDGQLLKYLDSAFGL